MPNKYFSIDGVAIWVRHTGPTTLPEVVPDHDIGHTVVCLHDAGGNSAQLDPLIERLAGTHSPFAFDQPGHARSGSLDSLGSIERMADFTRHLCEKLGFTRPVLLGHGMGAAVALRCALDGADPRALVLCAGAARFTIPDEQLDFTRRITEGKERTRFDRSPYAAETPAEVMKQAFMELLKTDPRVTYGDYLACRECDLESRLAEVSVPTLVIVGEEESAPLKEQAELLASRIPGARRVQIPEAARALVLEQPDKLADAVAAFLAELPA